MSVDDFLCALPVELMLTSGIPLAPSVLLTDCLVCRVAVTAGLRLGRLSATLVYGRGWPVCSYSFQFLTLMIAQVSDIDSSVEGLKVTIE